MMTSCAGTANESAETFQAFLCTNSVVVGARPPLLLPSLGFADARERAASALSPFRQVALHLRAYSFRSAPVGPQVNINIYIIYMV